jgi:hypothetical protein
MLYIGEICSVFNEFRVLDIQFIVLYRKNTRNYITYDIPIKLHKTHGQSPPLFSIYTFENSQCGQKGGPGGQHEYLFLSSDFLYLDSIHTYQ